MLHVALMALFLLLHIGYLRGFVAVAYLVIRLLFYRKQQERRRGGNGFASRQKHTDVIHRLAGGEESRTMPSFIARFGRSSIDV